MLDIDTDVDTSTYVGILFILFGSPPDPIRIVRLPGLHKLKIRVGANEQGLHTKEGFQEKKHVSL